MFALLLLFNLVHGQQEVCKDQVAPKWSNHIVVDPEQPKLIADFQNGREGFKKVYAQKLESRIGRDGNDFGHRTFHGIKFFIVVSGREAVPDVLFISQAPSKGRSGKTLQSYTRRRSSLKNALAQTHYHPTSMASRDRMIEVEYLGDEGKLYLEIEGEVYKYEQILNDTMTADEIIHLLKLLI